MTEEKRPETEENVEKKAEEVPKTKLEEKWEERVASAPAEVEKEEEVEVDLAAVEKEEIYKMWNGVKGVGVGLDAQGRLRMGAVTPIAEPTIIETLGLVVVLGYHSLLRLGQLFKEPKIK